MASMQCHRCNAEMATSAWRCSACGAQNRHYTRGQIFVAVLLGMLILFFMRNR